MKVTLVNPPPNPLETLIFTKSTRLRMHAASFDEIMAWPLDLKMEELEYMKLTIKSSWEFVEMMFLITGVTRAFTHQLVRHRVGTGFAQQSQRTVDMEGFDYITPPGLEDGAWADYVACMALIDDHYKAIIGQGGKPQDARGVIPTNVSTNIIFKANLRTLHEMARVRLCVKTQGEFQDVFRAIRAAVVDWIPWALDMIQVECCQSGTCAFPAYPVGDCPVKPWVYDPVRARAYGGGSPRTLRALRVLHARERGEAQPPAPPPGLRPEGPEGPGEDRAEGPVGIDGIWPGGR